MNCNCIKSDVCILKQNAEKALGNMFPPQFGGPKSGMIEIVKVIQKHCRHRVERGEDAKA